MNFRYDEKKDGALAYLKSWESLCRWDPAGECWVAGSATILSAPRCPTDPWANDSSEYPAWIFFTFALIYFRTQLNNFFFLIFSDKFD